MMVVTRVKSLRVTGAHPQTTRRKMTTDSYQRDPLARLLGLVSIRISSKLPTNRTIWISATTQPDRHRQTIPEHTAIMARVPKRSIEHPTRRQARSTAIRLPSRQAVSTPNSSPSAFPHLLLFLITHDILLYSISFIITSTDISNLPVFVTSSRLPTF